MTDPGKAWPGEIRWPYSVAELRADGVVHALGLVLVLIGCAWFLVARPDLSWTGAMAVAAYLATLTLSIAFSAAYNVWPVSRVKWVLRRFDHAAIYLLIAGTYTPFMVRLGDVWLMVGVWLVAGCGALMKFCLPGRFDRLSILLYLLLSWSGIVVGNELFSLPTPSLWLLACGGLVYSLGVIFHCWERLRFQNAIWHAFVLAAATAHYGAVWFVVRDAG